MTDEQKNETSGPVPLGDVVRRVLEDVARKREAARAAGRLPHDTGLQEGACPACGVVHRCALCHDYERISIHDPADPVRSHYVDCPGEGCAQRRHERHVARLEATEISDYQGVTFATFYPLPWQRAAYDTAREFATRTPAYGLLYLVGKNGSGKTHLAVSVARAAVATGHSALFVRTTTLLQQMRAAYDPEAPGHLPLMQLMAKLRDTECLVLDDFGQERMTKWSEELFFDLLDHRYVNWRTRATVITSNVKLSDLATSFGSRLIDTMRSSVCLLLGPVDQRARPLYGDRVVHEPSFGATKRRAEHEVKDYVWICHVCNCMPCHLECPLGGALAHEGQEPEDGEVYGEG